MSNADRDMLTGIDFAKTLDFELVKGKTALITGGAGAIGYGIATALGRHGVSVALLDSDENGGRAREESANSEGLTMRFWLCDPTSWESQEAAFNEVLKWSHDRLDIVIACAGLPMSDLRQHIITRDGLGASQPTKPSYGPILVNLLGSFLTTTLALFHMNRLDATRATDAWKPQLVLMSSVTGYQSVPFGADYSAAKAGVRGLWQSIRNPGAGMAPYQANLLAPGFTRSAKTQAVESDWANKKVKLGDVEDVVEAAVRCVCDPSIASRAIACPPGSENSPGANNFDLHDDLKDGAGSRALLQSFKEGKFGDLTAWF